MTLKTRPISWIRAARKDFEKFPREAQSICLTALTVAAEGGKADIAKPMQGLGSGIFEIALPRGMPFVSSTLSESGQISGLFMLFRRRRRRESRPRNTKSI